MAQNSANTKTLIGFPLYANYDSLDVAGPHQTFWMQDSMKPVLIGKSAREPMVSFEQMKIIPDYDFDSCPQLDILFVPGGVLLDRVLLDDKKQGFPFLRFLQRQAEKARLVTSVCTGAIFLAAAGLLDGYEATTHWGFLPVLKLFPKVKVAPDYPRYVVDRNRVTGGGISSGLDEGMKIVCMLLGDEQAKRGQLTMQYAPRPPFNSGDPTTAEPAIVDQVRTNFAPGVKALSEAVKEIQGSFGKKKGKSA